MGIQFLNAVNLWMKFWVYILLSSCCLIACSRDVYTLQPIKEKTADKILTKSEQNFQNGIDFIASGNLPQPWVLELDFDNQFKFKTATDSLSLLAVPATIKGDEKIYTLRDRAGDMDIIISEKTCNEDPSKRQTYIRYKNIIYSSCGAYLFDNKLAGVWEIVQLGNVALLVTDYKDDLPTLNFDIASKKLSGSSSCLLFSTDIQIEGQNIKVNGGNASANFKCSNKKILTHFNQNVFGKWMSYKINGEMLYFYLSDDSNISLRRKKN